MATHPDADLVGYLRGELEPAERERIERHLEDCPGCREDAAGLRELLGRLAASAPVPPSVDWARYRVELREKLDAGRARRRAWWRRPLLPLALSASLAGLLLFFAVWDGWRSPSGVEPVTLEEAMIGRRFGLLQQYPVVERLDFLEDFDMIRNLDQLAGTRES